MQQLQENELKIKSSLKKEKSQEPGPSQEDEKEVKNEDVLIEL